MILKTILCWINGGHRFDLADMGRGRDSEGLVSADCIRCGRHFKAEYGLALPGTFVKNSRTEMKP